MDELNITIIPTSQRMIDIDFADEILKIAHDKQLSFQELFNICAYVIEKAKDKSKL